MHSFFDFTLNSPIIDAVVTPSGQGYFLLGGDGGIYVFGDAPYHGSIQGIVDGIHGVGFPASEWLQAPIVGIAATTSGGGYWLVASDGGMFGFGDAGYFGSVPQVLPGVTLNSPIVGLVPQDEGYLLVAEDGGIFNFGSSVFHGSVPEIDGSVALQPWRVIRAVTVAPDRSGYSMLGRDGVIWPFGSLAEMLGAFGQADVSFPPHPLDSVDCSDFADRRAAQVWFDRHWPFHGDPAYIDDDRDRAACEELPLTLVPPERPPLPPDGVMVFSGLRGVITAIDVTTGERTIIQRRDTDPSGWFSPGQPYSMRSIGNGYAEVRRQSGRDVFDARRLVLSALYTRNRYELEQVGDHHAIVSEPLPEPIRVHDFRTLGSRDLPSVLYTDTWVLAPDGSAIASTPHINRPVAEEERRTVRVVGPIDGTVLHEVVVETGQLWVRDFGPDSRWLSMHHIGQGSLFLNMETAELRSLADGLWFWIGPDLVANSNAIVNLETGEAIGFGSSPLLVYGDGLRMATADAAGVDLLQVTPTGIELLAESQFPGSPFAGGRGGSIVWINGTQYNQPLDFSWFDVHFGDGWAFQIVDFESGQVWASEVVAPWGSRRIDDSLDVSSDGRLVLGFSDTEGDRLVILDRQARARIYELPTSPQGVRFSPDGSQILVGMWNGSFLLDSETLEVIDDTLPIATSVEWVGPND